MATRATDTMVFVWYKREHLDFDQKSASTQTSLQTTQDAGVQVEGQQRHVGRAVQTQTDMCKQKEAATQLGRRTEIGVSTKGTQVQVRNTEQGCQVTSVGMQ